MASKRKGSGVRDSGGNGAEKFNWLTINWVRKRIESRNRTGITKALNGN